MTGSKTRRDDPRNALILKYFGKRHRGRWYRSAVRMLIRELRADWK